MKLLSVPPPIDTVADATFFDPPIRRLSSTWVDAVEAAARIGSSGVLIILLSMRHTPLLMSTTPFPTIAWYERIVLSAIRFSAVPVESILIAVQTGVALLDANVKVLPATSKSEVEVSADVEMHDASVTEY